MANPRFWTHLAWMEIVQSYRRTLLGPLWITINLIIFTTATTLIYGALFSAPTRQYAAFVVCGMIIWFWIAALLTEVGQTFSTYGHFLKGTMIDKSLLIWTTAFKQVIILAHHMLVYIGLIFLGIITPTIYTLFAIPAFLVFFIISIPIIALASILFARYRDLPRLVSSTIVVLMMVTPIFWQPGMLKGKRAFLVDINPIYYLIEFVRRPLLGLAPDPLSVVVVLGMTLALWTAGAFLYKRYERYVIFWI
jgi:ABC-type polysaccharide/polyol phosphate export permease